MAQSSRAVNQERQSPSKKMGTVPSATSAEINQFYHLKLTLFISSLAWPVTYIFNAAIQTIDQTVRPLSMMALSFLLLICVVGGTAKWSYVNDWVYLGSVLFAFTAVIDLIITLELNGLIRNFMSEYLNLGEPYLASPWGSAICLFDGIGFFFMYLMLAHLISNRKKWRSLGIYWGAAITHSMVVLVLGIFTGKPAPTFCTFLNVPYVVFPILVLWRAFKKEPRPKWENSVKSTDLRLTDVVIALGLTGCVCITLAKGFTALAPGNEGVDFVGFLRHEPSFLSDDPAPFASIQAIVWLIYLLPIQLLSIFCFLLRYMPPYLWEISLVHAGITIQGQFAVIGFALDPQTPFEFKSAWNDGYFWLYNLAVLIVPHVIILRLLSQHGIANEKKGKSK